MITSTTADLPCSAFDNYFLKAQHLRLRVRRDFDRVFAVPNALSSAVAADGSVIDDSAKVHVLMHPSAIRTAPPLPPPHGDGNAVEAPTATGLDAYTQDVLTVPASLAGLPALSVPAGVGADGWPMGVCVVGQWGCDDMVLRVSEMVEEATVNKD
jgi:aspartyl-tRNA(Asn)/glutamyl-tRNA(Gln) amidotransferase subunit A